LELWDLYDKNGNKKEKSHRRGDPIKSGDFHMVVENWIKNDNGDYLIQKRTKPLCNYYNPWSTTAGSAIKGESSIIAIQRETQEEMGLFFELAEINFIQRSFFEDSFMDVYETVWNGNAEDIIFDPTEVSAVKWVTTTEIQEMYKSQDFYSHKTSYLQRILNHSFV
jgi:isopentenyldiphosphate isomerase